MTENRRRFFYNGFILTLVALAMRTVSLFFGAYVTRTVGEVGMGLYTLVSTVYGFAVTLATSGISLTVTRQVATALGRAERREASGALGGAFLYALIFGSAATVGLFCLSDILAVKLLSSPETAVSMRILAASLLPVAFTSVIAGYFVAVRRVGFNAAVQVISQALKIPITVWLVTEFRSHGDASSVAALCLAVTVTELISFLVILAELIFDLSRHGIGRGKPSLISVAKTAVPLGASSVAALCLAVTVTELISFLVILAELIFDLSRHGIGRGKPSLISVAKTAVPLGASAYVRSALLTVEHSIIPKRLEKSGEGYTEAFASYGALHGMALPMILYPMAAISSFAGLLVPEFAECSAKGARGRADRIGSEAVNTTLTYASVCAVFLFVFSEELGYTVYDSYSAGYYVAMLAPVVPIMYLDHVTDAMLKGVGEQIYSMWVNISDSFISIILVWTLIPRLGILGYAIAIIGMEAYNFILSALRLRRHVSFKVDLLGALVIPCALAALASALSRSLFPMNGAVTTPLWLILKMVFALCVFIAMSVLWNLISGRKKAKKAL